MCDQKVAAVGEAAFKCGCGWWFDNPDYAADHVRIMHVGEFNDNDFDSFEETVERLMTPSPLDSDQVFTWTGDRE